MNLLCPNCQKMLTVPEQYAGQLMKCPLCSGTFNVPALPPIPAAPDHVQLQPLPPSPPSPPPAPPPPPPPAPPEPETYGFRQETVQPAPLPPAPPFVKTEAASSIATPPAPAPGPTMPASLSLPPAGYTRTCTITLSPRTLQWVAPACVVLIFFLQFFTWDGLYPGGVAVITQGAWSAAFGFADEMPGTDKLFEFGSEPSKSSLFTAEKPDVSWFLLFYVLLFLILALPVTIAVIVLPYVNLKLPPQVAKVMPYRWGLVAAINLLAFLFLILQMLIGFSLERKIAAAAENPAKHVSVVFDTSLSRTDTKVSKDFFAGVLLESAKRTFWLRLVVLLHVVAILSAALVYWIGQRGERRPLPKIELLY